MESSMSSDTEDEVFFGPILAKENRIASKLRRRTEVFDPNFREKGAASCDDLSGSHTEISLSDVFEEEPSVFTTESPKCPLLPKLPEFKGESPVIDSPLPRDIEKAKSNDAANDQKESPFQMKGKALLDLIYKTKEEWSSPTQSPRNMTGNSTKSPMKRPLFSSSASESGESCYDKVPKHTCTSAVPSQDDVFKIAEPSMDNSGDFAEDLSNRVTCTGDGGCDAEKLNKDDFSYGLDERNFSDKKMHLSPRKNIGQSICQNLSRAFEENSNSQVEEFHRLDDQSLIQSRQKDNRIQRGTWAEKKRTNDADDSSQVIVSEFTHLDAEFDRNGEDERSSALNSTAISSIQSSQNYSLDSSVWSEHLSDQDQIANSDMDKHEQESTLPETSLSKSCSVCHDERSDKNENSVQIQVKENSLVTAPLSAFEKVNHQRGLGEISAAPIKDLSLRKFTPSMSSSPRVSACDSPTEPIGKDFIIPEGVHSEMGSVLQDSVGMKQLVNSLKYFPAITIVDSQRTDSGQEYVGRPELVKMNSPLKTGEIYVHSSPLLKQETQTTSSCHNHGTLPNNPIGSVLSPLHRNVMKLQSDSPLQRKLLLEQKRAQLMKLKQAKEEMKQKLTEESEKHFSLQVENALALRRNMASLKDIQLSPLLRENISRLESSPTECLDENSFDELTRFYTWKNSQQKLTEGSPYNSPLTTNVINRKRDGRHLRWVENLIIDVKELSSPSKPATRRKSILLKRM